MTLQEFKYWLEGFSHTIKGVPTKEQWEMIQGKLKKIIDLNTSIYFDAPNSNPSIHFHTINSKELPNFIPPYIIT